MPDWFHVKGVQKTGTQAAAQYLTRAFPNHRVSQANKHGLTRPADQHGTPVLVVRDPLDWALSYHNYQTQGWDPPRDRDPPPGIRLASMLQRYLQAYDAWLQRHDQPPVVHHRYLVLNPQVAMNRVANHPDVHATADEIHRLDERVHQAETLDRSYTRGRVYLDQYPDGILKRGLQVLDTGDHPRILEHLDLDEAWRHAMDYHQEEALTP